MPGLAIGGFVGNAASEPGQPADPVTFLIELGTPPSAASHFVPILRGEVTDAVCALLPQAATDVPAQWLRSTSFVHLQMAPVLIADLEPTLAPGHVLAGTLPGQLMYAVWYELNARAQQYPSVAGKDPAPTLELVSFRNEAERKVNDLFGAYFGAAGSQQGLQLLSRGPAEAAAVLDDSGQPSWGGWVTLAALRAIQSHPTLPRPGRQRRRLPWKKTRAQGAGLGLQLGETFLMATSLGLLDQAEQSDEGRAPR
jgi:hypothetical protein